MVKDDRIDVVTVVYEGDLAGLDLQARSLAMHSDIDLISQIVVIENFTKDVGGAWRSKVLLSYAHLASKVKFVAANDLAEIAPDVGGWWSQQVVKIEVARTIESDIYLVLDAKHHLTKRLDRSFIFNNIGQIRIRSAGYSGHPLIKYLDNVIAEFGLDTNIASRFPTTTPPFPIIRQSAIDLLEYAEQKSGSLLSLMTKNSMTEFFLYCGFLAWKNELEERYNLNDLDYPMIWPGQASDEEVERVVAISRDGESPFFAVHRRAVPELSQHALSVISQLWVDSGLFDNSQRARERIIALFVKPSLRLRLVGQLRSLKKMLLSA